MRNPTDEEINKSRLLLQNPYAHLDDKGGFSAAPTQTKAEHAEISASRKLLQDPYAHLDGEDGFTAIKRIRPHAVSSHMAGRYSSLANISRKKDRYSIDEIERKAISLQQLMWRDKHKIWASPPSDPIQFLDPSVAFELIGYDYDLSETLGQYFLNGKQVEVAGTIDNSTRQVRISRKFPFNIRSFTAAHEFGHAILHKENGLHRDRPMDGSALSRDSIEFEADKFATFFLMPRKLVVQCFKERFGTDCFSLNEDKAFALTRGTSINLSANGISRRDLAKLLADSESYNGVRFNSLANQFRVSTATMAIRLEELELVLV